MIGRQFSRWTVIATAEPHIMPSGRKEVRWLCRCECGIERAVLYKHLSAGYSRGCGCAPPAASIGDRFGRLTVLSLAETRRYKTEYMRYWTCRCDCGTVKVVPERGLRTGSSRSCGCLQVERAVETMTTHGDTAAGRVSPEYRSWRDLLGRCQNPHHPNFTDYGGRGITVCEAWQTDFPAFLAEVGRRPTPRHTIDRIDNERGYEPGNVRWATRREQVANRRNTIMIGGVIPLSAIARLHGVSLGGLRYHMLKKGRSLMDALTRLRR